MSFPRLALLTAVLLAQTVPLWAATVSIVQPAHPTPEVAVTLSRLRGELWSIGLAVTFADKLPTGQSSDADAVVAMVGDHAPLAVDVWLANPPSGQSEVIRIAVDPDTKNASEMLALRTIEVLRANLFEVDWERRAVPTPGQGEPSSNHPGPVGLEAGAAVLTSLDGVGPALLPTIRAGWAFRPRLVLRAALAGFGTRPTITTPLGSARISQQYGLVGADYRFRSELRLMPFLSLSLGALRTSVVGQTNSPTTEGDRASQWSFVLDGGLGIELRLWGHTYATLGAHLQLGIPHVAIHFVDAVAATSGRPNVLFIFTMGAWL